MPLLRRIRVPLLVAIALLLANMPVAFGFPASRGSCDHNGDELTWYFVDFGNWTDDEKDQVEDGINDWLTVLGLVGESVVDSISKTAPEQGDIKVEKVAGLSGLGGTDCLGAIRTLKLNASLTLEQFRDIAAHEMGHHLEMWHTGDNDHFGGGVSYLAICQWHDLPPTNPPIDQELSQDDAGHVAHKWATQQPKPIQANAGFEEGTKYWWKNNVDDFYISTFDPKHGSQNLRFRPEVSNGYVYQTMNLVDAANLEIDARIQYRKVSSAATTGKMRLQIWRQKVNYAVPWRDCERDQFRAGGNVDQNVRTAVYGFERLRTQGLAPTTAWKTGTETTPWTLDDFSEGFDVRIYVRSSVKYSNGDFALVEIDSARIRDKS
jgi:hypothetical protein